MENVQLTYLGEDVAQISVTISQLGLAPLIKKFVQDRQKNLTLKGFRKGHVPFEMAMIMLRDEAKDFAIFQTGYSQSMKTLQENKLLLIDQLELEKLEEDPNKTQAILTFKADVLKPISLNRYLGLELKNKAFPAIDEEVEDTLQKLAVLQVKFVDKPDDTVIGAEDVVNMKYSMSGEGFETPKIGEFVYVPNRDSLFAPDLFVGKKVGDKVIYSVTVEEKHGLPGLIGKAISFDIDISKVQETQTLTRDELAQKLDAKDEADLKEKISQEIKISKLKENRTHLENQIIDLLLKEHEFYLPQKLVDKEYQGLLAKHEGVENDPARMLSEEQRATLLDSAKRHIKADIIFNAIYERHPEIKVTDEYLDQKIAELALTAEKSPGEIKAEIRRTGMTPIFNNYIKNTRVVDFIIEYSETTD